MHFDDITISTKEQQQSNALLPMDTTESEMTTFSNEKQSLMAQEPIFVKIGWIVKMCNNEHPSNEWSSKESTEEGMWISVKQGHPWNA